MRLVQNPTIGQMMNISEVEESVHFKKTKIYQMIEEGQFPPQKKYGKASKWWSTQIEYFMLHQSWNETSWSDWVSQKAEAA